MTDQRVTLEVLEERLTNLIGRVTIGFDEAARKAEEQTAEIYGLKEQVKQQNSNVRDLKANQANHEAVDRAIHVDVKTHLEEHKKQGDVAKGRSEVLGILDKILLRAGSVTMTIGGLTYGGLKLYEVLSK